MSSAPSMEAISSAEPRKAPTQGVQPMEKTRPKRMEEKKPRSFTAACLLLARFKKAI